MIKEPRTCGIWDGNLTERRKEIERNYDRLLCQGRVSEEEMRGLCEDNLKSIRSLADFFAKYAA